ncbi:hypothetical protein Pst134EA_032439 [Puccinia striiformis f. sp. tritici]|uniref:uncharacterized protein n=1 Tax=Puccinia striiformis f. sp. tritici TaxID=168172 RepID=UPI002007447C|nr:uncharacterized protein Pst134EA_032439 [Puccinia striiformis f. sp. tritici]KAH9444267.1 hypothetical protein Pst134EA_032439 [Puccinia striiformis f. sp. tritici]
MTTSEPVRPINRYKGPLPFGFTEQNHTNLSQAHHLQLTPHPQSISPSIKMQFSTGYICILAAFMNISLLQTVAADAEVMSSLGGAKGKTATAGEAQEEPVPPNASGTVFTVALLYLEKTAGGAGGAAPGGAAAGGKGKKAKRSQ